MATVTGYTATKIDEMFDESITQAELVGDNLKLTTRGGDVVLDASVKGATGSAGPKGDPGDVSSGGYSGTLQDALDEAKTYAEDKSGKGLVAMTEYSTGSTAFDTAADSTILLANPSTTYTFLANRSYRIDFGVHISFGAGSNIANVVSLDLMTSGNMVRRVTIPGDEESHQCGLSGSYFIKDAAAGSKTYTLRLQKRGDQPLTILHSTIPSFIAITDLGNRLA